MSGYRRRSISKENQAEVEAVTNSKTSEDLRSALLNPYSKASQIQRNLEFGRLQHHVYIERIIELAAAQQLKVDERERKIILQQQIVAQLEKEKRFNEVYEEHYKKVIQEAEQNTPVTATVAQLTTQEWQQKIEKDREEIAVTEQKIEKLTQKISTINIHKELLQEAWQDLKKEQISQYSADLKEQNIQFKTATGATIDPLSKEGQEIINKVFEASPYELAEKYATMWAQIKRLYENEAQSQRPPISTLPADIMAAKGIPPLPAEKSEKSETEEATATPSTPAEATTPSEQAPEENVTPVATAAETAPTPPPPQPTEEEMFLTNISLKQVALMVALGPGASGQELLNLMKDNKDALNQIVPSGQKAEQNLQARYAAEADQNQELSKEEKQIRYTNTESSMLALSKNLVEKEAQATTELTNEKDKLAAQQIQLAQDVKGFEQAAKPAPE